MPLCLSLHLPNTTWQMLQCGTQVSGSYLRCLSLFSFSGELLQPPHGRCSGCGALWAGEQDSCSELPFPAITDISAGGSCFLTPPLGSPVALHRERRARRQPARHPIAVSKENLHRDGILVPVDLVCNVPCPALPPNGTSCLSAA